MGAQCIFSLAARHQDRSDVALAAVAGLAGPYDVLETYRRESPAIQDWLRQVFGAAPSMARTAYRAVSLLEVQPGSATPAAGFHMGLNLDGVPAFVGWSEDDTITYLPAQSEALVAYLQARSQTVVARPVRGRVPSHSWSIIPAVDICNFLAGHVLDPGLLQEREVLSDGLAAPRGAAIVPETGTLGYVRIRANVVRHEVRLSDSRSVAEVQVRASEFGLVPGRSLELWRKQGDGTTDEVSLSGWAPAPYEVRRGGVVDRSWRYTPLTASTWLRALGDERVELDHTAFDVTLGLPASVNAGASFQALLGPSGLNGAVALVFALPGQEFPLAAIDPLDPRWLRVSPFPPAVLYTAPVRASASTQFGLRIPQDPILRGLELSAQALFFSIGNELRLSSAELLRIR